MTGPRTFTATAVASKQSLTVNPGELATVVAAEKANLTAEIGKAGYRRTGPWYQSVMWAVGDDTTTPHMWKRSTRAKASARVVRITATAVPLTALSSPAGPDGDGGAR